jgi:hypothetical protein
LGLRGALRRLRNEELYDPYYSSNFIRVIKSRRMRWAGHVAYMGEKKDLRERDHLEDLRSSCRLEDNIKWNFKEWDGGGGAWAGSV